ncbi:MAG: DUF5522 domain-containing protein [Planctomycetaceae bacterium]
MPADDPQHAPQPPDSYFENGLLVYTAAYHLKRGHCCGSGCRHCPYAPKHVEGNRVVKIPHRRAPA